MPELLVDRTYKAYWYVIKQYIQSLPLKEDFTLEEYNKLRTSINIPSLGKIWCDYWRYYGKRKEFEIKQKIFNNKYKELK